MMPILPLACMYPGMIPTLQPPFSPGVMIPGQLGPISLIPGISEMCPTHLIISRIGIPSVMHTINPSPLISLKASAASTIAAAANLAGT